MEGNKLEISLTADSCEEEELKYGLVIFSHKWSDIVFYGKMRVGCEEKKPLVIYNIIFFLMQGLL